MTKNEYIQALAANLAVAIASRTDCDINTCVSAAYYANQIAARLEWNEPQPVESTEESTDTRSIIEKTRNVDIASLGLSSRVENCLRAGDITTLEILLRCSAARLFRIRNFGRLSFKELTRTLDRMGYHLEMLPAMWIYSGNYVWKTNEVEERKMESWAAAEQFAKQENSKIL